MDPKEKEFYHHLYTESEFPTDHEFRNVYLKDSENYFDSLISILCPYSNVLEIGCGSGWHSLKVLKAGAQSICATDISDIALNLTRARLSANINTDKNQFIKIQTLDVEAPIEHELQSKFDIIINHEVFSSLDFHQALPNLAALLKPNGKIIGIETFGHNPITNLKRLINVIIGTRTKRSAKNIMKFKHLDESKKFFVCEELKFFHFFVLAAALFHGKLPRYITDHLTNLCQKLDRFLMQYSLFQKYAFKIVFIWTKI